MVVSLYTADGITRAAELPDRTADGMVSKARSDEPLTPTMGTFMAMTDPPRLQYQPDAPDATQNHL
jgi:hypothetical protein